MSLTINEFLAGHNLRSTKPRMTIFNALKAATKPLSTTELIELCGAIDRASVYRTIDIFIKLRLVETVSHGWKQRYELAAPFKPHHHHLHCTRCGSLTEINSQTLELAVQDIIAQNHFKAIGHTFEITGMCAECQE